jgi:hypothetical protein
MKNIKDALLRMVRAGRKAERMQDAYVQVGLNDNMIHEIYGQILDGIYCLIGENTKSFEKSITYLAMTTPLLTDERRVEMLYAEYRKNNPEQPAPITVEPNEFREMAKKNGYLYETPEGDWS